LKFKLLFVLSADTIVNTFWESQFTPFILLLIPNFLLLIGYVQLMISFYLQLLCGYIKIHLKNETVKVHKHGILITNSGADPEFLSHQQYPLEDFREGAKWIF